MVQNNIRQICSSDNPRIQTTIESQAPPFQEPGLPIRDQGPSKSEGLHRQRGVKTIKRRGCRKSVRQFSWFLPPFLYSSKTRQIRKTSNFEHEKIQPKVYVQPHIQDDKYKKCQRTHSTRRSGLQYRFKVGVPYFTYSKIKSQVPKVHLERDQVPIQVTCHGSMYQPKGVLEGNQTNTLAMQDQRHKDTVLFRRCTDSGKNQKTVQTSQEVLAGVVKEIGYDCELGKESTGTLDQFHFHWNNLGYSENDHGYPRAQNASCQGGSSGAIGSTSCSSQETSKVFRSGEFHGQWTKSSQKDGKGSSGLYHRKLWGSKGPFQQGKTTTKRKKSTFFVGKDWSQSCENTASSGPNSPGHGCHPYKLGFSHSRGRGKSKKRSGTVQPLIHRVSHQPMRTSSSLNCCQKVSQCHKRQAHLSTNRQSSCKSIPPKSRGDQITSVIKEGMSNSSLSGLDSCGSDCEMGANLLKSGGRQSVQGEKIPRMVSESNCVQQNSEQVSYSDRSDGQSAITQGSQVFHTASGGPTGTGGGLFQSGLELSNNVLLSTPSTCTNCTKQVSAILHSRETQTVSSDCSMLDGVNLDACDNRVVTQGTPSSKVQEGSSVRPSKSAISVQIKSGQTKACGMDIMRQVLKQQGYPTIICNKVQEGLTLSSQRSYNTSWCEWVRWNDRKSMDPMWLSVVKLSCFLSYLFRHGLAWNTIGIYRSSICSILQPHKTKTCASSPIIKKLMKGFFKKRPPQRKKFTPWDVQKVLKKLASMGSPKDLNLKQLSWKTATLVALATGKRVADMSLMSMSQAYMFLGRDQIVFNLLPGVKTDRPGHQSNQVTIYRNKKNPSLCPVLYLKQYLIRTKPFRGPNNHKLWIGCNSLHLPVCARTIGSWIKTIITSAKAQLSPGAIRSVVASICYSQNVSIPQILEAGDWSTVSTVNNHYFRFFTPTSNYRADAVQRAVLDIN